MISVLNNTRVDFYIYNCLSVYRSIDLSDHKLTPLIPVHSGKILAFSISFLILLSSTLRILVPNTISKFHSFFQPDNTPKIISELLHENLQKTNLKDLFAFLSHIHIKTEGRQSNVVLKVTGISLFLSLSE